MVVKRTSNETKRIWALADEGMSHRRIAEVLREEGFPPLSHMQVGNVIRQRQRRRGRETQGHVSKGPLVEPRECLARTLRRAARLIANGEEARNEVGLLSALELAVAEQLSTLEKTRGSLPALAKRLPPSPLVVAFVELVHLLDAHDLPVDDATSEGEEP